MTGRSAKSPVRGTGANIKKDWCFCEWAFERAVQRLSCDSFRVKCDATNMRALDHYKKSGMTVLYGTVLVSVPVSAPVPV